MLVLYLDIICIFVFKNISENFCIYIYSVFINVYEYVLYIFCVSASLYIVTCILNVCYVCVMVFGIGSIGLPTMMVLPVCLFMLYLFVCFYVYR